MNIGIITLNGNFNYGNRLQLYALYRIYQELGFNPTVLFPPERHNRKKELARFAKNELKRLVGRPVQPHSPEDVMSPERLSAFRAFSGLMSSRCVTENELGRLEEDFDYFAVGSDQVWNPLLIEGYEDWYFLKFSPAKKRIAVAPSIGLDELDMKQTALLKNGVQGFERLSVREETGARLIKQCSGRMAEVLVDPTLIINSGDWQKVANKDFVPDDSYIFTYLLGGCGKDARNVLDLVCEQRVKRIVSLSDMELPGEPAAGPAEFIALIAGADHVITDSYHASVFSMLMGVPLTIVKRSDGAGMFSRLENLSSIFGLDNKIYGSPSFDISAADDYTDVHPTLDNQRSKFIQYLNSKPACG